MWLNRVEIHLVYAFHHLLTDKVNKYGVWWYLNTCLVKRKVLYHNVSYDVCILFSHTTD